MQQKERLYSLSEKSSIGDIQYYLEVAFRERGFENQPINEKLLLLMEEVGELAKAYRKKASLFGVDHKKLYNYDTIESEIADVFIVLVSICVELDIDLFEVFYEKEFYNVEREWSKL